MIFIQLNDLNSYCHDGVYAFFDAGCGPVDKQSLAQTLNAGAQFCAVAMTVQQACEQFRLALEQAQARIPGLQLRWTTASAEALAFERHTQLSDCELWQVTEVRLQEWRLVRYGLPECLSDPRDHAPWLVHSWLANLRNIGNRERASFLQLTAHRVIEVTMTPARDVAGSCWDAHLEVFERRKPEAPGVSRHLLAAAQDLADLQHNLVLDAQLLEAQKETIQFEDPSHATGA